MAGQTFTAYVKVTNKGECPFGGFVLLEGSMCRVGAWYGMHSAGAAERLQKAAQAAWHLPCLPALFVLFALVLAFKCD
jgi:hypothetical protein